MRAPVIGLSDHRVIVTSWRPASGGEGSHATCKGPRRDQVGTKLGFSVSWCLRGSSRNSRRWSEGRTAPRSDTRFVNRRWGREGIVNP